MTTAVPLHAQDPGEVARLRAELQALRDDYTARLLAIEGRLAALETPAPTPAPPAEVPPAAPPAEVPAAADTTPPPVPGASGTAATSKVFNPDIAVIGNFLGAAGRNRSDLAPDAFSLDETELTLQAIVDPYARADFFLTFGPEEVGVEEGFITFTTLPAGFLAKVGKMRPSFGKVNTMHAHVLPWVDRPLLVQNGTLGGGEGFTDSGVSVSRLFPNRAVFLEATGEVFLGRNDLFQGSERSDLGYVGRLRAYRDLTEAANLDLGTSIAYGHDRSALDLPDQTVRLLGADATFRWRPLQRGLYRRALARTEFVWTRRRSSSGDLSALGAYVSGEYQLARRWFGGVRLDRAERPLDPALVDKGGSLLLTFWPSEFSQIRAQYRHTRYGDGVRANELLFQLLFSIGAHGAHTF